MFERKNQSILSEHYTKLVDHSADRRDDDGSDDDFITLKRADHELKEEDLPQSEFISKRKQRMVNSKKALAKYGEKGHKLVFDDDGNPHEVYELKTAEEEFRGADDAKRVGKKFAEDERLRLRELDVVDKADPFPDVWKRFTAFMEDQLASRLQKRAFRFVTCGDWDLKTMLPAQLAFSSKQDASVEARRPDWTVGRFASIPNTAMLLGERCCRGGKRYKSNRLRLRHGTRERSWWCLRRGRSSSPYRNEVGGYADHRSRLSGGRGHFRFRFVFTRIVLLDGYCPA